MLSKLEIKHHKVKGRCVHAARSFKKGELIERCEMVLLPHSELGSGVLSTYLFTWSATKAALALGYGSLYSHSFEPNARYWMRGSSKRPLLEIVALRSIAPGEEITVSYNADPKDKSPLWFTPV